MGLGKNTPHRAVFLRQDGSLVSSSYVRVPYYFDKRTPKHLRRLRLFFQKSSADAEHPQMHTVSLEYVIYALFALIRTKRPACSQPRQKSLPGSEEYDL